MSNQIILSYHLPSLGHISATLHKESASIFRAIDSSGELQRIKSIPQLGVVSEAWPGARHTRYEYIVLLVYLINYCKERTELRLNTSIKLGDRIIVSSQQELLSSWALILQTGHLYWTFTSERVLLEQVRRTPKTIDSLLGAISNSTIQEWAKEVIDRSDYYRFHQLIAYHRLKQRKSIKDNHIITLAESLLDAFIVPRSPTVRRAKELFTRLRRIAYLSLDSEYSPSAVGLRLNRILSDPQTLENLINFQASTQRIDDELHSIEAHLVRNVYLGRESLLTAAQAEEDIVKRVQDALSNNNLNYIIEELARSDQIRGAKREIELNDVIRLGMDTRWLRIRKNYSSKISHQKSHAYGWAVRHNVRFNLAFEQDANNEYLVYQAHVDPNDRIANAAAISYAFRFLNETIDAGDESFNQALIQRWFVGMSLEAILLSTLSLVSSENVRWEWKESLDGFRVLWLPSLAEPSIVDLLIQNVDLSKVRQHEIDSTIVSVAKLRLTPAIVSVSNLLAYKVGEYSPHIEFDGLALTRDSRRDELVLTLVEAKRKTHRAEGESRKDLREKLSRLCPIDGIKVSRIRSSVVGRRAYAWCHLRMPYVGPKSE